MSLKIEKKTLTYKDFKFNAMAFTPENVDESFSKWALFTHGYTANKSDCLNWAQRLVESNVPSVIFDLPGHHLGSYNAVKSFEDFTLHAHHCFISAFNFLKEEIDTPCKSLAIGGHSLGGLLSLRAIELKEFREYDKVAIGVGLGINTQKTTHLFESSFYEKTLQVRRQLVDENLDSDKMFPWIKKEKDALVLKGQKIHLICGIDDIVVGEGGAMALRDHLSVSNEVTLTEPRKLAHHEPSKAATYIHSFLKDHWDL